VTPTATALIPAHNEAATITRCVAAVRASTYPLERVVVVADACTDGTATLARRAGAEVVETTCRDKAGAQNTALPSITSDLVAGFDADTFPHPDCIERMVRAMTSRDLDAVCATVLPVQPRGFFIRSRRYAYALGRRWWRVAQSAVGRVQVLTGAAYVFRTSAIRQVGGFPTVGISADMDATWTLHAAGYRLAYVGDALAFTVDPETFADYRLQMRRWAAGYFQTMAKHRRQLAAPRAVLVVWTALFDLICLPAVYSAGVWLAWSDLARLRWLPVWLAAHLIVTTVLVATVVGWKEACLGAVPYTLVNFYNKGLYLWALVREWGFGAHYASWTGRHGRPVRVTPAQPGRAGLVGGLAGLAVAVVTGLSPWLAGGMAILAAVMTMVGALAATDRAASSQARHLRRRLRSGRCQPSRP
jgi:cellulose synthase/poly-beta-1,6-N-acetylglucosamine synthase-like glycosyltransferase